MTFTNVHEAKTHLSRLIDQAVNGDVVVIAKAGKPVVKLVALEAPTLGTARRLGFLSGLGDVPADFDTMGMAEVQQQFEGP